LNTAAVRSPAPAPLLAVRGLTKRFAATRALDGVDFDLVPGEVHALCGENGAGKSTLVNILAGLLAPDSGRLEWRGQVLQLSSPAASRALGIAVIHQDFDLAPNLSLADNLLLGREPRRFGVLLDRAGQRRQARRWLERVGLAMDPDTPVAALDAPGRQSLAIARALSQEARVLVMDEPTASLDAEDTRRLLERVRSLRAHGTSVIFISHKLGEVFALADRITVLRDGRSVGTSATADTAQDEVIAMMVGRAVSEEFHRSRREPGPVVLATRGLGRGRALRDVDLEIRAGEVVGVYGLQGAGRTALVEALFGLAPANAGHISIDGADVRIRAPLNAIQHGLALVPGDRKARGLFPNLNVRENLTLAALRHLSRAGLLDRRREREVAERFSQRVGVRAAGLDQAITQLSGGNQQKVLLARWLVDPPRVLILHEPTSGVDVGARAEIYALLEGLLTEGVGILLVTSELPELQGLSDRILVLHRGAVVARMEGGEGSEQHIMQAIQAAEGSAPGR